MDTGMVLGFPANISHGFCRYRRNWHRDAYAYNISWVISYDYSFYSA